MEATAHFLQAVNFLFESSLLGDHVRVFNSDGSTIERMKKGYDYFVSWASEYAEVSGCDTKNFISWQVHV